MSDETLFSESQKFKQIWLWLVLLGINGFFFFAIIKQVVGGQEIGEKPIGDAGILIGAWAIMLVTALFISFRLDTFIKKDGIYVRFFPLHIKFKYFAWNSLEKIFVRQYSPIKEYGGWGLRYSLFGKGKAYNISGNKGLQLEFTSGKKLLIGTNKPDELTEALIKIGRMKQ